MKRVLLLTFPPVLSVPVGGIAFVLSVVIAQFNPYNRAFVTSSKYPATLGGIDAYDAICGSVAQGAQLGGTSWYALLTADVAMV